MARRRLQVDQVLESQVKYVMDYLLVLKSLTSIFTTKERILVSCDWKETSKRRCTMHITSPLGIINARFPQLLPAESAVTVLDLNRIELIKEPLGRLTVEIFPRNPLVSRTLG
jgi:hypothetical protein